MRIDKAWMVQCNCLSFPYSGQGTISYIYNKISGSGSWACPLGVTVILDKRPLTCGVMCQSMPECIMFATDGGNCIITDISQAATTSAFDLHVDWFVRD